MTKPQRVQYSRKHKLVSPNDLPVVYVGRPTKWGNPFKLVGDMIYIDAGYRRMILNKWVYFDMGSLEDVIKWYQSLLVCSILNYEARITDKPDLTYWYEKFNKLNVLELEGKNLACWCPLDKPCHADILLKLANPE